MPQLRNRKGGGLKNQVIKKKKNRSWQKQKPHKLERRPAYPRKLKTSYAWAGHADPRTFEKCCLYRHTGGGNGVR